MTATETQATASAPATPPARLGNPWAPTWHGTRLVTRIELLRRRPSTRGYIMYGIVFAFIVGLGILVSVVSDADKTSLPMELVVVLVLGAGMLIGPSLSATSINGDSGEGVLAPLQMTHLTAGDIALGKLFASWLVAFAALVTMTPFLIYAFVRSGWSLGELLIVLAAVLFVVLTATAIGLAWSAIAARAVASVSLAHLTTGTLVLGTLLAFAMVGPLVSKEYEVQQSWVNYDALTDEQREAYDAYNYGDYELLQTVDIPCTDEGTYVERYVESDKIAWLLLINPVVMISETSPIVNPETYEEDGRAAPGLFAQIHSGVGQAYLPDTPGMWNTSECDMIEQARVTGQDPWGSSNEEWERLQEERATFPRSPWLGLAVQLALLAGSLTIVVRRLKVPYKTLRVGTRVA